MLNKITADKTVAAPRAAVEANHWREAAAL